MTFDNLPQDPIILLSFINTRLRDQYPSLEALCDDMNVDSAKLCAQLAAVGYVYDRNLNKFI
ncbi:MAG: DUF4250 domain-containing protein [Muribaculaceae bacterium]|nr:DUF4250 domain-containing protein [Muribaculaceae bacterium]